MDRRFFHKPTYIQQLDAIEQDDEKNISNDRFCEICGVEIRPDEIKHKRFYTVGTRKTYFFTCEDCFQIKAVELGI